MISDDEMSFIKIWWNRDCLGLQISLKRRCFEVKEKYWKLQFRLLLNLNECIYQNPLHEMTPMCRNQSTGLWIRISFISKQTNNQSLKSISLKRSKKRRRKPQQQERDQDLNLKSTSNRNHSQKYLQTANLQNLKSKGKLRENQIFNPREFFELWSKKICNHPLRILHDSLTKKAKLTKEPNYLNISMISF